MSAIYPRSVLNVFRMIHTANSHHFHIIHHSLLYVIDRLISLIEARYFLCELRTGYLYVKNTRLRS